VRKRKWTGPNTAGRPPRRAIQPVRSPRQALRGSGTCPRRPRPARSIRRRGERVHKVLARPVDTAGSEAPAAPPVTRGELDTAINAIGAIHRKYYQRRRCGKSLWWLTPVISPGWIRMFGTAWMPPGFNLPDDPRPSSPEHGCHKGRTRPSRPRSSHDSRARRGRFPDGRAAPRCRHGCERWSWRCSSAARLSSCW